MTVIISIAFRELTIHKAKLVDGGFPTFAGWAEVEGCSSGGVCRIISVHCASVADAWAWI